MADDNIYDIIAQREKADAARWADKDRRAADLKAFNRITGKDLAEHPLPGWPDPGESKPWVNPYTAPRHPPTEPIYPLPGESVASVQSADGTGGPEEPLPEGFVPPPVEEPEMAPQGEPTAAAGPSETDFNSLVEAAAAYRPGDLEAGTYVDTSPQPQLDYFPERDKHGAEASPAKTPYVSITHPTDLATGKPSVLPHVEFPLVEDMLQQRWLGSNFLDEAATRMDAAGAGKDLKVAGYSPTGSEIVATADKYGLSNSFFDKLASARSPDDLEALGLAYGNRVVRDRQITQSATGVSGFVAENAVAMLDPSFLLTLGGVGELAKVGSSATRFGNAIRASAANVITMLPVEAGKATLDPGYSWEQAGTTVLGSAVLGGALGSLSRGAHPEAVNRLDAALAKEVEHQARSQTPIEAEADGTPSKTASVGAAQAQPILRDVEPPEATLPERAPEKAGFGRFGTPTFRLASSDNPLVRFLNEKLGWDTGSKSAQGVTVGEASRRVFEAGTVYAREARMAAQAFYRDSGELGNRVRNPFQQPSSQQLRDFMETVEKVKQGVAKSDNPHVLRAVKAFREGTEDGLMYVKNSSYNGPGSEGLAGLSNHEFADIEPDPKYGMRRFSAPGWRRVMGVLGRDGVIKHLTDTVYRSNQEWLLGRARKIEEDRHIEAGKPTTLEVPKAQPSAPASPEPVAAKDRTPNSPDTYTPEEMFGGKAPKTASKEADSFYTAMLKGTEGVRKFLDTLLDPENYSRKSRGRIVADIFETEGIDAPIPQSADNVRKKLTAIFDENRKAAEKARGEAPAAEAPKDRIAMMKEANRRIKERAKKAAEVETETVPHPDFEAAVQKRAYQLARRIAAKYSDTVAGLLNDATTRDHTFMPVDNEFRKAAKEIVAKQLKADGETWTDHEEEAIEQILDLVAPIKRTTKESARAKSRLKLDLNESRDKSILDMWDWNAEALYTTYRRQTAGYAGFLKAGYQSVHEVKAQVEKLRRDQNYNHSEEQQKRTRREADLLDHMIDASLGRPPKNIVEGSKEWIYWTTQLRRMNFSRMMGNTGFLSLSEVGGSMVQAGPFRLLASLPSYMKYMHDIRSGDPKALESIYYTADALMGHGSSQVRSRMVGFANRMDDELSDVVDRKSGGFRDNVNTFTRKAANATARLSGMAPLTEWLRSAVVGVESQDWVRAARKGVVPYGERRMRALGVNEAMWKRISAQLNKMTDITSPDTGQARPFIDFGKWDDGEAANVFMNALDRNTRRLILEGDHGHTSFNLKRPSLSLLFQFLNYPMNAWSKQAMFAFKVRDQRAIAETIAMSLGGGVGYMARVAATAYLVKKAGQERDKYLASHLSNAEVAKAMFYYSAHASILPNLIDLPLSMGQLAGYRWPDGDRIEPVFSKTRGSGLSADPLMGNATRTGFYDMIRSAGEVTDGKLSRQDASDFVRSWFPLGNHILTQAFMNDVLGWLPDDNELGQERP